MDLIAPANAKVVDAGTTNTPNPLIVTHNSTGTPAAGFGVGIAGNLKDTVNNDQTAGQVRFYWASPTSGTASGNIQLIPYRAGTGFAALEVGATGFGNVIGFLGATPAQIQNQIDIGAALNLFGLTTGTMTVNASTLRSQLPANPIDNASFNIWQRGTSFTSVADGTYTADRWKYVKSGSMVHTISRDSSVPAVSAGYAPLSSHSLKLGSTTASGTLSAGNYCAITHTIEGYNWAPFAQQQLILSFWVKASQNGMIAVSLRNSGQDRSYVSEYLVSGIGSWQQIAMVIPASPSGGTWDYTTGAGVTLSFALACGSTYQTTAGTWQTGNYLGTSSTWNVTSSASDYMQIAQVMLQTSNPPGGSSQMGYRPQVQPIPYQHDLQRCQRYYVAYAGHSVGQAQGGSRLFNEGSTTFPVEMRQAPTLQSGATYSVNAGTAGTVTTQWANTKSIGFYNPSNNWTTNALVQVSCGLSADL